MFIPSHIVDLYKTLVSLPRSFLARDDIVTIVPAFEYTLPKDTECNSFTSCINKYDHMIDITNSIKNFLPSYKKDVIQCVSEGRCDRFRVSSRTHVSIASFIYF